MYKFFIIFKIKKIFYIKMICLYIPLNITYNYNKIGYVYIIIFLINIFENIERSFFIILFFIKNYENIFLYHN